MLPVLPISYWSYKSAVTLLYIWALLIPKNIANKIDDKRVNHESSTTNDEPIANIKAMPEPVDLRVCIDSTEEIPLFHVFVVVILQLIYKDMNHETIISKFSNITTYRVYHKAKYNQPIFFVETSTLSEGGTSSFVLLVCLPVFR